MRSEAESFVKRTVSRGRSPFFSKFEGGFKRRINLKRRSQKSFGYFGIFLMLFTIIAPLASVLVFPTKTRANASTTWIKNNNTSGFNTTPVVNDASVGYPRVIKDGSTYKMWLEAGTGNIKYATSSDGITWSAFTDLTGDENIHELSIIKDGSTYKMWFNAIAYTGYKTSSDGMAWSDGPDVGNGVGRVVYSATNAWDTDRITPSVIKDGSTYKMYYNANEGNGDYYIAYATSSDGTTWTEPSNLNYVNDDDGNGNNNLLLEQGGSGIWDGYQSGEALYQISILKNSSNVYEMWYGGNTNGSTWKIGYATSSDGLAWTKSASNPILSDGGSGEWDDTGALYPSVIEDSSTYKMWYTNNWSGKIGYATAPATWSTKTIDAGGEMGSYNSITYDSNNRAHIAYYDDTNGDLKYAYFDGTTWQKSTVDSTGNVGGFTSIGIDSSNRPHISYFDFTNYDLKYAYYNGVSWEIATIDSAGTVGMYSSIAIDSSDKAHISYYDNTNVNLKYATNASGSWVTTTVDSDGWVGFYTSLAVDSSNYPHISYTDGTNNVLKYTQWNGTQWIKNNGEAGADDIETTGSSYSNLTTSIAIDSSNYSHISYYYGTGSDLKYATNVTGSWVTSTVDSTGNVGRDSSIALDYSNRPHISYHDVTNLDLKYASYNGSTWSSAVLDSEQNNGQATHITVGGNDQPQISYYDFTSKYLKYATTIATADATPPTSVVSTPDAPADPNSAYSYNNSGLGSTFTGTASDANGISAVSIRIKRNSDNYYWNEGTQSWQSKIAWNAATGTTSWSWSNTNLKNNLTEGVNYTINSRATDNYSNPNIETNITDGDSQNRFVYDNTGPATIGDLSILAGINGATLYWTAPSGIVSAYDIRYSTSTITEGNWASATQVSGEPNPASAGSTESMYIAGLTTNTNYYFAIKSRDGALPTYNYSSLSNVPSAYTWIKADYGDYYYPYWDTSLALDSNNRPHISSSYYQLNYTYSTGCGWQDTIVDSSSNNVGDFSSIKMDSNNYAHISYYDTTNGNLKYATNATGSWVTIPIDSTGNVGQYTSLGIDSSNKVHISYYDVTNGDLKYATNATGSWVTSVVDTVGYQYTSIAIDSNNYVHIGYRVVGDNGDLKYATNATGSWVTSVVDVGGSGNVGMYPSIAVNSTNQPYISYYDMTNSDLKYSYYNGTNWQTTIAYTGGSGTGQYTSIAIDSGDFAHIGYQDGSGALDRLGYATNHQDTTPPTSVITNLSDYYNVSGFPATISGTAMDDYSCVASVDLKISKVVDSTTYYWKQSTTEWTATETWNTTTGTAAWSFSTTNLASNLTDGVQYTVNSRATDNSSNANVETNTTDDNSQEVFTYDTSAPTSGSISIAGGATYTTSTTVNLTLSATDATSGMYQMRFSNDNATWSDWESYATSKTGWILSSGDGTKTVYVQYKDNATNTTSSDITDTITYDGTNPISTPTMNDTYSSSPVTIVGTASNSSSGVASVDITVRRSGDNYYWTGSGDNWQAGITWVSATYLLGTWSRSFAYPQAGITYTVSSRATDNASNVQTSLGSDSFSYDTTAPATVANLIVAITNQTSATLTWTAPGDDGSTGTATTYDVRYSTSTITSDNWASATQATGEPSPSIAGSSESMTVSGLVSDTIYYFAIKTSDEVPNTSDLSNIASYSTWEINNGVAGNANSEDEYLALDSYNTPKLAYLNTSDNLNYSYYDGAVWQTTSSVEAAGTLYNVHLALFNNKIHISYYDADFGEIRHAYYNGSSWSRETVDTAGNDDDNDIAVDSLNHAHIVYSTGFPNFQLKHAYYNGASWQTETIDTNQSTDPAITIDSSNNIYVSYVDNANSDLKYAYYNGATWSTQTLDSTGSVGWENSIALDSSNRAHISYADLTNNTLKHAYYNGASWQTETIDSSGNQARFTSIAIDSNNQIYISYHDQTNGDLKYAHYIGGNWYRETLDTDGTDIGTGTAISIDSNNRPHIGYGDTFGNRIKYANAANVTDNTSPSSVSNLSVNNVSVNHATLSWTSPGDDNTSGIASSYSVRYSTSTITEGNWASATVASNIPQPAEAGSTEKIVVAGLLANTTYYFAVKTSDEAPNTSAISNVVNTTTRAWNTSTLDSTGNVGINTIAIDSNNRAHISYFYNASSDLRYTYYDGAAWQTQTVDSSGSTGLSPSIALDSNNRAHISYCTIVSFGTCSLKYSYYDGAAWQTTIIDSNGNVGGDSSIAIDSNNKVYISYYDSTNADLKYATNVSGSWVTSTVNSSNNVGEYSDIALDSNNRPHISYYDAWNTALKYAYYNGTSWQIFTIDSTDLVGKYTSIIIDSDNRPHISYYATTNANLKYAYHDGAAWQTTTIDSTGNTGEYTSIIIDSNNHPYVTYYDSTNSALKFAFYGGVAWYTGTIDSTGTVGYYTSVAIDSNDQAHISYYYYAGGDLKYATTTDLVAPAAVSNLASNSQTSSSVALTWTAPGDDNDSGTATTYDVRYSTSTITEGNWVAATQATGEPTPSVAGSAETMTVSGLTSGTSYYFAIKTSDEMLNVSGLSNVLNVSTTDAGDSTPPTITSVSSGTANGNYNAGDIIDIDVIFSENVTSNEVTVTLETGNTDRTCTFIMSGASTGTCDYTVQAGDTSSDLNSTISGTIVDQATPANAMTDFVPTTNLAVNKALVIDTTSPTVAEVTAVTTPTNDNTPNYTFSSTEAGTITYGGDCSSATTAATAGNNTITFSTLTDGTHSNCTVRVTDTATNQSNLLSVASFVVDTVIPDSTVAVNTYYNNSPVTISGTATNGSSGVASVAITIQRSGDDYYWTGSVWQSGINWLSTTYDSGNWNYGFSGSVDGLTYTIQSRATDNAGNVEGSYGTDSFSYDTTVPSSTPTMNDFYTSGNWTGSITGTATDDTSGVAVVQTKIQRSSDSYYWTGSAWQAVDPEWQAVTSGTTSWLYTLASANLTNAVAYTVTSRATDNAGNIESTGTDTFMYHNMSWQQYRMNPVPGSTSLTYPSIIKDGSTYKMWYNIGWSIYYAYSTNGITWEAGNPNGEGVNQAIFSGTSGQWDSYGVLEPWVVKDGSTYKMWYSGTNTGVADMKIGYATSVDGITWTKYASNPVLEIGSAGQWDDRSVRKPVVYKDGSTYKMWYAGTRSADSAYDAGYATSTDGITWTKYASNPVVTRGSSGSWDAGNIWGMNVLKRGSVYEMYYSSNGEAGSGLNYQIGFAYSTNGTTWTKHSSNPIMTKGASGSWNEREVYAPFVMLDGSTYKMWYAGYDGSTTKMGYATIDAATDSTEPNSNVSIAPTYFGPNTWNSTTSIMGTATDAWGIEKVELKIQRSSDSHYWTGSAWSATEPVDWPDANDYSGNGYLIWNYPMNSANLSDTVTYTVTSRATDGSGTVSGNVETSLSSDSFTYDSTSPTATLTQLGGATPTSYYNTSLFSTAAGTASDATSSVNSVYLSVKRSSDNKYWNNTGSLWQTSQVWDDATGTNSWTYSGIQEAMLASIRSAGDGEIYTIYAAAMDNVSNNFDAAAYSTTTFTYDNTGPTVGSVNDGMGSDTDYTSSTTQLSANWSGFTDSLSGIASYQYSIGTTSGGTDITSWTSTGSSTSVTKTGLSLSNSQTYYVNVRAIDTAGNTGSAASSDGITVDTSYPTSIPIVGDYYNATSWTGQISGTASAGVGVSQVEIRIQRSSDSKYWDGDSWETGLSWLVATGTTSWTYPLTATNLTDSVTYTISSRATDTLSRLQDPPGTDAFTYDTSAPINGSISINSGATYTTSTTVNLTLSATDATSGMYQMRFSNDNAAWSSWETYATSKTGWTLSSSDGIKTVYVQFKDNATNTTSSDITDTITYDATAPSAISSVYDGTDTADDIWTNSSTQLSANWIASTDTGGSGIQKYQYKIFRSSDGEYWNGASWQIEIYWFDNSTNVSVTKTGLSLTDGETYYFGVRLLDNADNASEITDSDGVVVDATIPDSTVAVNTYYNSSPVTISGTATNGSSGVASVAISIRRNTPDTKYWDGDSWETDLTWIVTTYSSGAWNYSFTSLADGTTYTIQSRATDNAGNVEGSYGSDSFSYDTTGPTAPGTVRDGTSTDQDYTTSTTQLSANWTNSTDSASGIQKYQYALGTTAGGTNTVSWTDNSTSTSVTKTELTLLNGSTYYFTVRAVDNIENTGSVTNSDGIMVDNAGPQAPGTPTDSGTYSSNTSQIWNWTAATDSESGIAGYYISIGTTAGATDIVNNLDLGNVLTYTRNSLSNGAIYYVKVRAYDAAGNTGSYSGNSNGITIDTTAPISDPQLSRTYYSSSNWPGSITVNLSDATSGIGIAGIAINRNSDGYGWCSDSWTASTTCYTDYTDPGNSFTYAFSSDNLTTGQSYTVDTYARDNALNIETPHPQETFTYDNTGPSTPTVNDGTGADTDQTTSITTLSANWTAATDLESGVTGYEYAIGTTSGGTNVVSWTSAGTSTSVTRSDLTLTIGATYYFSIRATNGAATASTAGNSDGITVIDQSPPSISITISPTSPTNDSTPQFVGTVTDTQSNIASIEYKIDSGSWTSLTAADGVYNSTAETFNFNTPTLTEGSHTIYIRATDSSSNITAEANYGTATFVVDLTAPSAPTIDSQSGEILTDNTPILDGSAEANSTVLFTINSQTRNYSVDTNSYGRWTYQVPDELEDGSHTLAVKVRDRAGNEGSTTSISFTIQTISSIISETSSNTSTTTGSSSTATDTVLSTGKQKAAIAKPKLTITVDLVDIVKDSDSQKESVNTLPNSEVAVDIKPLQNKPVKSIEGTFEGAKVEFTDSDGDGTYSAQVLSPTQKGSYEMPATITYEDGTTEDVTVEVLVDPYGYVFEKNDEGEQRLKDTKVTLYVWENGKWQVWNASQYDQTNPQTTKDNGEYGFMVPEGKYYLAAEKKGYQKYKSKELTVEQGEPINLNIKMSHQSDMPAIYIIIGLIIVAGAGIVYYRKKSH